MNERRKTQLDATGVIVMSSLQVWCETLIKPLVSKTVDEVLWERGIRPPADTAPAAPVSDPPGEPLQEPEHPPADEPPAAPSDPIPSVVPAIEMYPERLDSLVVMAQTIYGEARNQSRAAKEWVGWVIKNRVILNPARFGRTIREVALRKAQFSCWLPNDPNRAKLLIPIEIDAWHDCLMAAWSVINHGNEDPTSGVTHYFDRSMDQNPPLWAAPPALKVPPPFETDFRFYTRVP